MCFSYCLFFKKKKMIIEHFKIYFKVTVEMIRKNVFFMTCSVFFHYNKNSALVRGYVEMYFLSQIFAHNYFLFLMSVIVFLLQ